MLCHVMPCPTVVPPTEAPKAPLGKKSAKKMGETGRKPHKIHKQIDIDGSHTPPRLLYYDFPVCYLPIPPSSADEVLTDAIFLIRPEGRERERGRERHPPQSPLFSTERYQIYGLNGYVASTHLLPLPPSLPPSHFVNFHLRPFVEAAAVETEPDP